MKQFTFSLNNWFGRKEMFYLMTHFIYNYMVLDYGKGPLR